MKIKNKKQFIVEVKIEESKSLKKNNALEQEKMKIESLILVLSHLKVFLI